MAKVIVIVGPTCSGKSRLGYNLARELNSEIISADSRQFYRLLDIGTAKPSEKELSEVKHHFINSLNVEDEYNVSKFIIEANVVIDNLTLQNKIPIVVGGSGLYIKGLIDGIVESADTNNEIREVLLQQRKEFGNEFLYEELKRIDPTSADKMLSQNWKRVIRALEVLKLTGKPIWQHHQEEITSTKYSFIQIGLNWERDILYKNIELRVDEMIENGLVEEVKNILNLGYSKELNSLNTVGYKEIIKYLDNEISLERAIELIKRNTRRYAKRQMTWFRKDSRIEWHQIESYNDIDNLANLIAKGLK